MSWSDAFPIGNFAADGTYVVRAYAYDGATNVSAAEVATFTIDTTGPSVTLSGASGATNVATHSITAQFSEGVTGFAETDVVAGNGAVSNFAAVDADTYTFDVTATADGSVTVDVAAGVAIDAATNGNTVATQLAWIYDATGPSVTLSTGAPDPTNVALVGVTAQFSEGVTGFADTDVVAGNGAVSNFAAVDADTYTFDVTATADGSVTVDVAAGVAIDAATNGNTVATQLAWIYDATAPTASITFPANGGLYNAASWTDLLSGTASDTGGAGLSQVKYSVQQGAGDYWNGASFASASEFLNTATGTSSWSDAFPIGNFPADGTYIVRAYAYDAATNVSAAAGRDLHDRHQRALGRPDDLSPTRPTAPSRASPRPSASPSTASPCSTSPSSTPAPATSLAPTATRSIPSISLRAVDGLVSVTVPADLGHRPGDEPQHDLQHPEPDLRRHSLRRSPSTRAPSRPTRPTRARSSSTSSSARASTASSPPLRSP